MNVDRHATSVGATIPSTRTLLLPAWTRLALVAVVAATGAAVGASRAYSAGAVGDLVDALNSPYYVLLLPATVCAAIGVGRLVDRGMDAQLHAVGADVRRLGLGLTGSSLLVGYGSAAAFAGAMVAARRAPAHAAFSTYTTSDLIRAAACLGAVVAVATALAAAAARLAGPRGALAAGLLLASTDVAATFAPRESTLSALLGAASPTYTLRGLAARSDSGHGSPALGVIVIVLGVLWAADVLIRPHLRHGARRPLAQRHGASHAEAADTGPPSDAGTLSASRTAGPGADRPSAGIAPVVAGGLLLSVLAGVVGPPLLTAWLPWRWRPSTLFEDLSGQGPEAAATALMEGLWSGRVTEVQQHATAPFRQLQLQAADAAQRPLGYRTTLVPDRSGTRAAVALRLRYPDHRTDLTICLQRSPGGPWMVRQLDPTGTCTA